MVGDGHAIQGDGESCLSAAETVAERHLRGARLARTSAPGCPGPRPPTHHITIGIDQDLDDAARQAIREMITLIRQLTDLSAEDAYTLCSLAADVRISQLVNVNKGCHMMLAKSALEF